MDVALPLPLQTAFSYRVPERWPMPERGIRVTVPFGARRVIGMVVGPSAPAGARDLKDVLAVVDEEPLLPPPLLDLAQWTADHYLAPPGECYRLALPPAGVRASRARVRASEAVPAGVVPHDPVLRALAGGPLTLAALERRIGRDPSARVARLRAEGKVVIDQDLGAAGFRHGARGPDRGSRRHLGERAGRPRCSRGCGRRGAGPRWPTWCATARRCGAPSTGWRRQARWRSTRSARCATRR